MKISILIIKNDIKKIYMKLFNNFDYRFIYTIDLKYHNQLYILKAT
jgi:hypothetical protein